MDKPNYQLIPLGDQAIMVQMADQIDPQDMTCLKRCRKGKKDRKKHGHDLTKIR